MPHSNSIISINSIDLGCSIFKWIRKVIALVSLHVLLLFFLGGCKPIDESSQTIPKKSLKDLIYNHASLIEGRVVKVGFRTTKDSTTGEMGVETPPQEVCSSSSRQKYERGRLYIYVEGIMIAGEKSSNRNWVIQRNIFLDCDTTNSPKVTPGSEYVFIVSIAEKELQNSNYREAFIFDALDEKTVPRWWNNNFQPAQPKTSRDFLISLIKE